MKINLEEDREKLITQLQQKAIEFETFIREKQNEEHQKEGGEKNGLENCT